MKAVLGSQDENEHQELVDIKEKQLANFLC